MKHLKFILFIYFCLFSVWTYGQICPNVPDLSTASVCGPYGDPSGKSNWDWELTNTNDPNYCKNWYANINAGLVINIKSPFANPWGGKLSVIRDEQDYTKAKGWELLKRDFGCLGPTANPYFVLYNKYRGLMRIFVYFDINAPQGYSEILITAKVGNSIRPAVLSNASDLMLTPDRYLSQTAGSSSETLISVGESSGRGNWSVAEFNTTFDPNIQNNSYFGTELEIGVYGIVTNTMQAYITGNSVTTGKPSNFSYVPKEAPTQQATDLFDFKAAGEKITKMAKDFEEVRKNIHDGAKGVSDNLKTTDNGTLKKFAKFATEVADLTSKESEGNGKLTEVLGSISGAMQSAGGVLSFAGTMIGLFTKSAATSTPGVAPTYTSYNLELQGQITARTVISRLAIRVPGTNRPNLSNAPYYDCPLGIFNLSTTPVLEGITYSRYAGADPTPKTYGSIYEQYTSYRVFNDIGVTFNSTAGLELVSAQAAIVGKVPPKSATDPTALYDPFAPHVENYYVKDYINHMLADLEANRMIISHYDIQSKQHVLQTPYVNMECLRNLAFNVRSGTLVFLRVKAILKRTNDPANVPIFYIKDYAVEVRPGTNPPNTDYANYNIRSINKLPPYANYSLPPNSYTSDITVSNTVVTTSGEVRANHSILTSGDVIVQPTTGQVLYRAGSSVTLTPGFTAQPGSIFRATTDYGYRITCGTPQILAYQHPVNCYNTGASAARQAVREDPEDAAAAIKVYPVPSTGMIQIKADAALLSGATLTVHDFLGKEASSVKWFRVSDNLVQCDLQLLPSGMYIIRITGSKGTINKKIILRKE